MAIHSRRTFKRSFSLFRELEKQPPDVFYLKRCSCSQNSQENTGIASPVFYSKKQVSLWRLLQRCQLLKSFRIRFGNQRRCNNKNQIILNNFQVFGGYSCITRCGKFFLTLDPIFMSFTIFVVFQLILKMLCNTKSQ